jgi:hypothetical protein
MSREERLAAALRQNLRRRKAAARAKAAARDSGAENDAAKPQPDGGLKPAANPKH